MLKACPVIGKQKSVDICNAFIAGAPKDAKGRVFYGVNDSNFHEWNAAHLSRDPWFYCDNAYFDKTRGQQFRVTKNRMQVEAHKLTSDGKRFEALGIELKSWRPTTTLSQMHWLVIEQSPAFMKLIGEPQWLTEMLRWVGGHAMQRPVRVRQWLPNKPDLGASLTNDLRHCWLMLTHSSAAAVTAVCEGVPVAVASVHALSGMTCGRGTEAHYDQRRQFMNVLADHQFTIDELRSGYAWRILNP